MEEMQLIQQAQQGDELALAALLQKNYSMLIHYLIKVTLDKALAEDLAQETMLVCIQKIQTFKNKAKFSSWMITIANHLYLDTRRRKKREQQWREQEQSMRKLRWQTETQASDWSEVLDALAALSPEIRLTVIMKHYYGYGYHEIAQMMNIPEGTAKSRVHSGLKTLRKELESDGKGI